MYYESYDGYYLGAPKIKYFNYMETSEANMITGLQAGTLDIAEPSYSTDVANQVALTSTAATTAWMVPSSPPACMTSWATAMWVSTPTT